MEHHGNERLQVQNRLCRITHPMILFRLDIDRVVLRTRTHIPIVFQFFQGRRDLMKIPRVNPIAVLSTPNQNILVGCDAEKSHD